ncbi:MAG: DUF2961 domain-containing protein [Thermoproteales archaeon]|nr:DUF2961 domain-containing protein [Thermoproteales archaeon]
MYFNGLLDFLPQLKDYRVKRESSWDKTGGNRDFITINKGDAVTIARIKGPGIIKHIWITIHCKDPHYLRKILFRAYWDGENNPSIDTPIGDFFGIGHGVAKHFISLPLSMSCDKGFNCYFPMPFNDEARFEVVNECDTPVDFFYYHIDYEVHRREWENVGYFHAKWRRELTKASDKKVNLTGEDNYLILYAKGRGHYVGCILSVHGLKPGWWGEGDDMIFVDDEKWPPSLHGTGTEDYIGAAWGFNREFYGPFHGFPLKGPEDWTGYHSMYRFHLESPIPFTNSIKVTIEHGHANDRADDISSVAYWYQVEPHIDFAPMPPAEKRIPLPVKQPHEILSELLEEIKSTDKLAEAYWYYVYSLRAVTDRITDKKKMRSLTVLVDALWKEIHSKTIARGDVEEARKTLLEVYDKVIKSIKGN